MRTAEFADHPQHPAANCHRPSVGAPGPASRSAAGSDNTPLHGRSVDVCRWVHGRSGRRRSVRCQPVTLSRPPPARHPWPVLLQPVTAARPSPSAQSVTPASPEPDRHPQPNRHQSVKSDRWRVADWSVGIGRPAGNARGHSATDSPSAIVFSTLPCRWSAWDAARQKGGASPSGSVGCVIGRRRLVGERS